MEYKIEFCGDEKKVTFLGSLDEALTVQEKEFPADQYENVHVYKTLRVTSGITYTIIGYKKSE